MQDDYSIWQLVGVRVHVGATCWSAYSTLALASPWTPDQKGVIQDVKHRHPGHDRGLDTWLGG